MRCFRKSSRVGGSAPLVAYGYFSDKLAEALKQINSGVTDNHASRRKMALAIAGFLGVVSAAIYYDVSQAGAKYLWFFGLNLAAKKNLAAVSSVAMNAVVNAFFALPFWLVVCGVRSPIEKALHAQHIVKKQDIYAGFLWKFLASIVSSIPYAVMAGTETYDPNNSSLNAGIRYAAWGLTFLVYTALHYKGIAFLSHIIPSFRAVGFVNNQVVATAASALSKEKREALVLQQFPEDLRDATIVAKQQIMRREFRSKALFDNAFNSTADFQHAFVALMSLKSNPNTLRRWRVFRVASVLINMVLLTAAISGYAKATIDMASNVTGSFIAGLVLGLIAFAPFYLFITSVTLDVAYCAESALRIGPSASLRNKTGALLFLIAAISAITLAYASNATAMLLMVNHGLTAPGAASFEPCYIASSVGTTEFNSFGAFFIVLSVIATVLRWFPFLQQADYGEKQARLNKVERVVSVVEKLSGGSSLFGLIKDIDKAGVMDSAAGVDVEAARENPLDAMRRLLTQ